MRVFSTTRLVPPLLSVTIALALVPASAWAEDDATEARERELAFQFMKVTGVPDQGAQLSWGLMSHVVQRYPDVPEEVWLELHDHMTQELVELSLPIYVRNFDEGELRELIDFYNSSIGRKLLERTPVILQESAVVFDGWGEAKLAEITESLKTRGYEPVSSQESVQEPATESSKQAPDAPPKPEASDEAP